MKTYDRTRTNQAEIAQLIILESLFSLRKSREIGFQGGTAIRWFYGGMRFSEDLDFVTSLEKKEVVDLLESAAEPIRRLMIVNFGTGSFSVKGKKALPSSYKAFIQYQPSGTRRKISVKVEFERLAAGLKPDMIQRIMQTSSAISYFVREGELKTLGAPVIVNLETPQEILSDKLRALLERPYKKGRDFFDIWFLTKTLQIVPDAFLLERKLEMYEIPFVMSTPVSFYTQLDALDQETKKALARDMHQDLARFLNPETVEALERDEYRELFLAVQTAFRKIEAEGIIGFGRYPKRKRLEA